MSTGLVWFRRDLRVDDHPSLAAATAAHDEVVTCFVLDPAPLATAGARRRDQLLGFLGGLDAAIRERGGRLVVVEGDPAEQVPALAARVGADTVHLHADTTPYSRRRDDAVEAALAARGIGLEARWGTLVHPPGSVLTTKGTLSQVFTPFHRRWERVEVEPAPDGGHGRLVDPGPDLGGAPPMPDGEVPLEPDPVAVAARVEDFAGRVDRYDDERDLLAVDGTSGLSVDLRFGTVSPRALVSRFRPLAGGAPFVRQLAWRDWYAHLLWERPDLPHAALRPDYDRIRWRDDPDEMAAWFDGTTGYPVVDAAMRQLHETGIVHNRARMIAASFLVKDLLVDWRHGERHYRRHLLDADLANNAGNWQWVAGTGADAAPYFRIFNPLTQSRRFDPSGTYLRRFLPELAGLDDDAIHSPSELGPLELAAAGVELGRTYPEPIVDHAEARDRCLAVYRAAVGGD